MEIIQEYAKELFSVSVPLLIWLLDNWFRARAKLNLSSPHAFTFLVQEPVRDADGNVVQPNQNVHTASYVLTNAGKDTATHVELVFNWKPPYLNIWPSRHYTEHTEDDGRHVLIFESLAPGEQVGCEMFSVNTNLPTLMNARSDQCVASTVRMSPQPVVAPWKRRLAVALVFFGFAFVIYITVLVIQFLVLATPLGP